MPLSRTDLVINKSFAPLPSKDRRAGGGGVRRSSALRCFCSLWKKMVDLREHDASLVIYHISQFFGFSIDGSMFSIFLAPVFRHAKC